MSSIHVARQGFVTKSALPSVSRERGSTTVADNRTVLLLNGNGTNGAQNNTFLTENFGSASGRGNYSVFFDGNGDTLDVATTNTFAAANEDFTLEFWIYKLTSGSLQMICGWSSNPFDYCAIGANNDLSLNMNNNYTVITSSNAIQLNQWHHVAFSRVSNVVRVYVDGTQVGSNFSVSSSFGQANNLRIGNWKTSPNYFLNGYISNFRFVKGTGLYSSNFTPPTSELTAITNTSLLTCQGTVIRDASSNNFAITVNGDAKVATNTSSAPIAITRNGNATQGSFSPFTLPDGQWSNYFDGSGDRLSVANNAAFQPETGDFSVEGWIYSQTTAVSGIFGSDYGGAGSTYVLVTLNRNLGGSNVAGFIQAGLSDTSSFVASSTAVITNNTWNHVVFCRTGTTISLFVNGTSVGTATNSTNVSPTTAFQIGDTSSLNRPFTGSISNVRFIKGSHPYDATASSITVPTAPLTAISGTSLLTCQSNRFIDKSSNNFAITRNGDVRVTPWSPFAPTSAYDPATNGGSGYFDGTGDYISVPTNSALSFGTGDFTIEFWMYMTAYGSANQNIIDFRGSTGSGTHPAIYLENVSGTGTKQLRLFDGSSDVAVTANNFPLSAWHHIAATRSGTSLRFFVNGVQVGSTATNSTNYTNANGVWLGAYSGNVANYFGHLSNVRVVKGTAVYTANFTPPTAPVTNITNTSLLLNFTNAGIFDTAGDNVIETVGNAQIDTAIKKYGSGSLEFDGTGDYLLCYSPRLLPAGREPFTIEFWMRANAITTQTFVGWGNRSTNNFCGVQLTSAGNINFYNWGNDLSSSGVTIATNTWYHIACQYDGNTKQIYIDGVLRGSASTTTLNITATDRATVGAQDGSNTETANGYIDDLRITKGFARYTANFTPPTTEAIIIGTVPNIVNNSTYGVYQLA